MPRRGGDTIVGPLRFNMQGYSPLLVPLEQRSWMRLAYAHRRRGTAAVTLRACRHRRSRAAQRRECRWAEGVLPGSAKDDYTACRSGATFFSGGFEIDYDDAPRQGRCAELIVWVKGEQEPERVRLLRVAHETIPGEICASRNM
jgi:hypothetical protein